MLESYIFRQTYAKFLPKTNSITIVKILVEDGLFCKRLISTISKQEFHQNFREVLT